MTSEPHLFSPAGGDRPGSRPLAETSIDDDLVWGLVEAAPDALVVVDGDGLIELVNTRLEDLFGYHRSALLGRPVEVLVAEAARSVHRAHRVRYRAAPAPRVMGAGSILLGRRADGSEFPVEVSLSPVAAASGQRIIAAIRDVTDRLDAERTNRAVRYALDAAVDGIFIADPRTVAFTYVNHELAEMHGYTVDETLGMTPLHLCPDLNSKTLEELVEPLRSDRVAGITYATTSLRKDGTEFPNEIHLNRPPASADGGNDRPLVGVVRDITQRVQAERTVAANQAWSKVVEDRGRLGRDLHDRVIGDLFGAGLKLQSLAGQIADDRQAQELQATVYTLDDIIKVIRNSIFDITPHPEILISTRIEQQINKFHDRLGHQPSLRISGPVNQLSDPLSDAVLILLHEALTNVVKHAAATHTSLTIDHNGDQLIVTITDDGAGMSETHRPGSLGINNLRTRAQAFNGTCTFEEGPTGCGVTVTWTVPLASI